MRSGRRPSSSSADSRLPVPTHRESCDTFESPLRTEAFQTRHAASRVWNTPREHPQPTIYRRDVWTTDAVPFGVLEYRVSIEDADNGETIRRTTMRAVAAGRVKAFDPASLIFE